MLKSKKLFISGACMLAMAGMVAPTAINAQEKVISQTGDTTVTYDNRNVIPDDNHEYGMIIPTAISFTEAGGTADASVSITGINGHKLSDWKDLDVTVHVKSANTMSLKSEDSKTAAYQIVMDKNKDESFDHTTPADTNEDQLLNSATENIGDTVGSGVDLALHLGVGGTTVTEYKGEAKLMDITTATTKGQYTDTLTYSFTENSNTKK